MANIRRFQQLGRAIPKKQYSGQLETTDGVEITAAAIAIPPMMFPKRHWLRWKIFSDSTQATLRPHMYQELRLSCRLGDIDDITLVNTDFDTAGEIDALTEKYLPNATGQNESDTTDADSVGITGGEYQSQEGKMSEILERKYTLGLPNHAMLVSSNEVIWHAIGNNNKNPYINAPRGASVEKTNWMIVGITTEDPIDVGAMDDNEDDAIMGGSTSETMIDVYERFVGALPAPSGDHVDFAIRDNDLELYDTRVHDYMTKGYTRGDYQSDVDPHLHYVIDWTIELGIYGPHQSTTLTAP